MNELHLAAARGDLDTLRNLLTAGADPNTRCPDKWYHETPLTIAMIHGQAAALRLLLEAGAQPSMADVSHGLGCGCGTGPHDTKLALLEILLEHGLDPNAPRDKEDGSTLLMAMIGHTESLTLVPTLLDHGADLHARDNEQCTPFLYAATSYCEETIRLLHARGADVNAQDIHGRSALIRVLFIHDDDWEMLTNSRAPIDYLEWEEDFDLIHEHDTRRMRLLLACGTNPRLCDNRGWAPLLHCLATGNLPGAHLLLEHGATLDDVSQTNLRRARRVMALHHHTQTLRLLIELMSKGEPTPPRYIYPLSERPAGSIITFARHNSCSTPLNPETDVRCLRTDALFSSGLYFLLEEHVRHYNPFDDPELQPNEWEKICAAAEKLGGSERRVVNELREWVGQHFTSGARYLYMAED